MKWVQMLKDDRGAPEGHTVVDYDKDEMYELPDALADSFISAKSAKPATAPKPAKAEVPAK